MGSELSLKLFLGIDPVCYQAQLSWRPELQFPGNPEGKQMTAKEVARSTPEDKPGSTFKHESPEFSTKTWIIFASSWVVMT